ncbi:MAG: hypothetical protein CMB99_16200 [Flavobacteriaceae bacterium]|nr:hypothetical protein [Flavobacteriaceae bacterium]|tara:strand:+ start:17923 stop:18528 length:606 start_codon:yes stop_codon:yes gene_type:complete
MDNRAEDRPLTLEGLPTNKARGARLTEALKEKGLDKNTAAAAALGVDESTIRRWKDGGGIRGENMPAFVKLWNDLNELHYILHGVEKNISAMTKEADEKKPNTETTAAPTSAAITTSAQRLPIAQEVFIRRLRQLDDEQALNAAGLVINAPTLRNRKPGLDYLALVDGQSLSELEKTVLLHLDTLSTAQQIKLTTTIIDLI